MDLNQTAITVTREELVAAYRSWNREVRSGNCLSVEEVNRMPLDLLAEKDTDALLHYIEENKKTGGNGGQDTLPLPR